LARSVYHRLSFTVGDSVAAFRVKLGANDLNCVDVPLNPTHSDTGDHYNPPWLTATVSE